MMNQLFQDLNGPMSLMGQFQNFLQNPMMFLLSRNVNIPQQYQNDPQSAVNYLVSSGQMDQNTLNNLRQKANQMGYRF